MKSKKIILKEEHNVSISSSGLYQVLLLLTLVFEEKEKKEHRYQMAAYKGSMEGKYGEDYSKQVFLMLNRLYEIAFALVTGKQLFLQKNNTSKAFHN